MRLQTSRETLLKPLQHVVGVVERRHTLPILANVRLIAKGGELLLTASDLEVELSANAAVPVEEPGEITFPARKMLDILRALPEAATVSLAVENDKLQVRCGRSRFSLLMLPVEDFPVMDEASFDGRLRLSQAALKSLIDHTHFAMAQQDVRYYLNGLLLEITDDKVTAVATDGHRLALENAAAAVDCPGGRQVIVPRKGVQELLRLLGEVDDEVDISFGPSHLQVTMGDSRFTSKLIDGKFPDYRRVIPRESERVILVDRLVLRNALARAAILSSEKSRGVRLKVDQWVLQIQAHNPEQEEAVEEVEVNYDGEGLEIGFNVTYLLDALGALSCELVKLSITDASSSCLLLDPERPSPKHVVMPMRL